MRDETRKTRDERGKNARRPTLFPRPPARPREAEWARADEDEDEKTQVMAPHSHTIRLPAAPPIAAAPPSHAPVAYTPSMHRIPAASDASVAPLITTSVRASRTTFLTTSLFAGGGPHWLAAAIAGMAVSLAALIVLTPGASLTPLVSADLAGAAAVSPAPAPILEPVARIAGSSLPGAAPGEVANPPRSKIATETTDTIELPDSFPTFAAAARRRSTGPQVKYTKSHVVAHGVANPAATAPDKTPPPAPKPASGTSRGQAAPTGPAPAPAARPLAEDAAKAVAKEAESALDDALGGAK